MNEDIVLQIDPESDMELEIIPERDQIELDLDIQHDDFEIEAAGLNEYPAYSGQTTIRPELDTFQILPTGMKVLFEDVAVMPIPITDTINLFGGRTIVIG